MQLAASIVRSTFYRPKAKQASTARPTLQFVSAVSASVTQHVHSLSSFHPHDITNDVFIQIWKHARECPVKNILVLCSMGTYPTSARNSLYHRPMLRLHYPICLCRFRTRLHGRRILRAKLVSIFIDWHLSSRWRWRWPLVVGRLLPWLLDLLISRDWPWCPSCWQKSWY